MKDAVLITGASRGLGRALAQKFDSEGHVLILGGRDKDALIETAANLHGNTVCVIGDLRDPCVRSQLAHAAEMHEIGILINNAGTYLNQPFGEITADDLQEVIDVNLVSPILLTQQIYEMMRTCGGGVIVNINSLSARMPGSGETIYAASKGGLRAFSEALNQEAAKSFVHIINVTVGAMDTAMQMGRTNAEHCINVDEAAAVIYLAANQHHTLRLTEIELRRARY